GRSRRTCAAPTGDLSRRPSTPRRTRVPSRAGSRSRRRREGRPRRSPSRRRGCPDGRDPYVEGLFPSAELESPPLEARRFEAAGGGGFGADQDLTGARQAREARGDVDRVAEGGEVSDIALPHAAHERRAGVDTRADRNPSARLLEEAPCGCDRVGRMIATREAGDEERDRAVADELVDDPVAFVDDFGGSSVEAREQARELFRRHL